MVILGYIEAVTGPQNYKKYRGRLPAYQKSRPYSCMTRNNCQLKSSAMAKNTFNVCSAR